MKLLTTLLPIMLMLLSVGALSVHASATSVLSVNITTTKGKPMTTTYPAKHISITINRPASQVYEFTADPRNWPQWAEGLSRSALTKEKDEWVTDSPMGKVKVKFTERNNYGILDHDVTLPNGQVNYNPLRVVRNGQGSEVTFTLFRLPKVTDAEFEKDAQAVQKDLTKLKELLEKSNNRQTTSVSL